MNHPHPLVHVAAKLNRARDHFNSLQQEIAEFFRGKPYEILREFKTEERAYVFRAKAKQQVPLIIRLLAGEVVCHLRSTLDYLAWQLALLRVSEPRKRTAFPISINSTYYGNNRGANIGDLPDAAQTIIDELQPYRSEKPEEHPLWILDRFANEDKHRLLSIIGATPHGVGFPTSARNVQVGAQIGTFDDQTEIGRLQFLDPSETNMEVEPIFFFGLAFPRGPGRPLRLVPETLKMLRIEVGLVITRFRHFFPD